MESQLERVIEHLLKLEHSPGPEPRKQWMITVNDARMTPTIRRNVESMLPEIYRAPRDDADLALRDHGETDAVRALPTTCPYALDDLLLDKRWPTSRHGLTDSD